MGLRDPQVLGLATGDVAGIVAAAACIWWTLRGLERISERSLLMGQIGEAPGDASLVDDLSDVIDDATWNDDLVASAGTADFAAGCAPPRCPSDVAFRLVAGADGAGARPPRCSTRR